LKIAKKPKFFPPSQEGHGLTFQKYPFLFASESSKARHFMT